LSIADSEVAVGYICVMDCGKRAKGLRLRLLHTYHRTTMKTAEFVFFYLLFI